MQTYYSHGKLLLSAEYVVLDGAKALAIPTVFGQSLHIEKEATNKLTWNSLDHNQKEWFNAEFSFQNETVSIENTTNSEVSNRLLQIITAVKQLNPKFLKDEGFKISTVLELINFAIYYYYPVSIIHPSPISCLWSRRYGTHCPVAHQAP